MLTTQGQDHDQRQHLQHSTVQCLPSSAYSQGGFNPLKGVGVVNTPHQLSYDTPYLVDELCHVADVKTRQ